MIKFGDEADCPDASSYQRLTKPLIEKRRRARINLCLMQLKEMVIDSGRHHIQNPKCKYEKADILELTVDYLQSMHSKQQMNANLTNQSFNAGFLECLKQVEHFMRVLPLSDKINQNSGSDRELISHKLLSHLDFCRLELTNSESSDERPDPALAAIDNQSLHNLNSDRYYDQNVLTPNSFSVIQHTRDYSSSISSTSSSSSTRTVSPPPSPEPSHRPNASGSHWTTHSLAEDLIPEIWDLRANNLRFDENERYGLEADGVWRPW